MAEDDFDDVKNDPEEVSGTESEDDEDEDFESGSESESESEEEEDTVRDYHRCCCVLAATGWRLSLSLRARLHDSVGGQGHPWCAVGEACASACQPGKAALPTPHHACPALLSDRHPRCQTRY